MILETIGNQVFCYSLIENFIVKRIGKDAFSYGNNLISKRKNQDTINQGTLNDDHLIKIDRI